MKNTANSLLDNLTQTEKSAIAERIKYLRSNILHMTQSHFADHVKISQTYLSMLENGKKDINEATICQISTMLRVNLDWLVYGIGEDNNIFQSEKITKDYLEQSGQQQALSELQKAYFLKNSDIEFITWYLNLPTKERSRFSEALTTLATLYRNYPSGS